MQYKSKSVEQTYHLASCLASLVKGGDIILLNGDLGAGKTTFVKGFAQSIGINKPITSPTFNLLKTYESPHYRLVHIDAYRLEGASFEEIEEYISLNDVLFIEWANCLANQELLQQHLSIDIQYCSKNQRNIIVEACGEHYEKLLKELEKHV